MTYDKRGTNMLLGNQNAIVPRMDCGTDLYYAGHIYRHQSEIDDIVK